VCRGFCLTIVALQEVSHDRRPSPHRHRRRPGCLLPRGRPGGRPDRAPADAAAPGPDAEGPLHPAVHDYFRTSQVPLLAMGARATRSPARPGQPRSPGTSPTPRSTSSTAAASCSRAPSTTSAASSAAPSAQQPPERPPGRTPAMTTGTGPLQARTVLVIGRAAASPAPLHWPHATPARTSSPPDGTPKPWACGSTGAVRSSCSPASPRSRSRPAPWPWPSPTARPTPSPARSRWNSPRSGSTRSRPA